MKSYKWLPLAAFLLSGCSSTNFPENPRLVVFFVVDQLPGELMQRIESEFTGGFKWLLDHGVDFRNAHQEHANTVTGTGYFVLGSGRYPGSAGVLGNSWYVRELGRSMNCVEDTIASPVGGLGKARSYRQTNATAIGDWIKENDIRSKVFSVGGKDRAAVFLGGKNADLAIYYDWAGSFMTSDYYTKELPEWLVDYNEQLNFAAYRDSVWSHIAEQEFYAKYGTADHQEGEVDQFETDEYSPTLPISLKSKTIEEANEYIGATPWFDKTVLELATVMMEKEELGQDESTDLLGVGISMADWIGHDHGPHSHEVLDYYLRLDKYLMTFIQRVDELVGLKNAVFVLSSDHGVGPLPEYLRSIGIDSERMDRDDFKKRVKKIEAWSGNTIKYYGDGFYFPDEYIGKQKADAFAMIADTFSDVKAIDTVLTRDEIYASLGNDSFSRRLRNMIHPEKSPDVIMVLKEYYSERSPLGVTHGTPYDYDTHVPIVFSHKSFKSQKITRAVATVDIAPTIARLVGAEIPMEVDGNVLEEIFK